VQSSSRFNALDTLVVVLHSVKMPVGFGGIKTKGRPLSVMAYLKKSIIEVKAENSCLADALIIAVSKFTNVPNYNVSSGKKNTPRSSTVTRDDGSRTG
jgi:hypothetical protein